MAGGYLGNVYNEYASGNNLMSIGSNLVSGTEKFADTHTDIANLFGMLGILIVLVVILVLGYKYFSHSRKH